MRCTLLARAVLAVPLIAPCLFAASNTPDFTGAWQLNEAKSPSASGQSITLTIQEPAGKINFSRVARDRDGKELTSQFSCQPGGTQCDFDENGHKAKVSLWYDGPALMILKTDGPKEDSVTQWKLELSPDGKQLNVDFTHIEPNDKSEKLVFDKKTTAPASATH
jgi:hypothetical protein